MIMKSLKVVLKKCRSVAEPEPVEPKLFRGTRAGAFISYFGSTGFEAEIIFLINIFLYCRQFGGCVDKLKLISTKTEKYFL